MNEIAGIGSIYRKKLGLVLRSNSSIITVKEVSNVLKVSSHEAGRLLSRWCKNGWISRIKRGAYIPVPISSKITDVVIEDPYIIAQSLFGMGYIGGFTAIKHWDFSEQIIESITYFTLKKVKDRNPVYGGIKFFLKTTSKYKMFGLKLVWNENRKIRISDPTKTIIDILDNPGVIGGIRIVADVLGEYLNSEYYDFNQLMKYGMKMNNQTIFKRLGFLLELNFNIEKSKLRSIHKLISPGYTNLDPTLRCHHYLKEWRLRVSNSWLKEYDRKK